jgi:hypothetical protein
MTPTHFDASIPVLTEVFTEPAVPPQAEAAPLADDSVDLTSTEDWNALEQRVTQRVLNALQSRTDFVLEQRVRDVMTEVLEHALKELTADIRAGLHETLEQIVTRAVAQEITHLQTLKK